MSHPGTIWQRSRAATRRFLSDREHRLLFDTVAALSEGLPLTLEEGRRVLVGILRGDSPLAGVTLEASAAQRAAEGLHVVTVIRGEHMMAPRPELELLGGDRLVLVVDDHGTHDASRHVTPW